MVEYLNWLEGWMEFTESSFSAVLFIKLDLYLGKLLKVGGSIPLIGHYIFIKGWSHSWPIAVDCKSTLF